MYMVDLLDGSGRRTSVDLHLLEIAGGEKAFTYLNEPAALFRALKQMKVPEIQVGMGSIDLMLCLARHRAASVPAPVVHKRQPEGNAA
jgi:hypothetical protein